LLANIDKVLLTVNQYSLGDKSACFSCDGRLFHRPLLGLMERYMHGKKEQ